MQAVCLPGEEAEETRSSGVLSVPFGPLPFSAMRRVRRVLTDKPRSRRAIAKACDGDIDRTSAVLTKLVKAGLARKAGSGYVRSGTAMPVLTDDVVPMEIGRQILLCLTEPRRAKDIARIINRPPSNATGQLQHLLRRGLVVRVSKGVYALAAGSNSAGEAVPFDSSDSPAGSSRRCHTSMATVATRAMHGA